MEKMTGVGKQTVLASFLGIYAQPEDAVEDYNLGPYYSHSLLMYSLTSSSSSALALFEVLPTIT